MLRCVVMVMVVAVSTTEDGEGDTTPSSPRSPTSPSWFSASFSRPPYLPSTVAPSSLSSTSPPSTDGSGDSLVWTQLGWVTGVQETSTKGRNFYSYYNIPYAKPPLGKLRFKDPVEADPWEGVRVGKREYPTPCIQIPFLSLISGGTELVGHEDCLYLNVFSSKPNQTEAGLPVLVYIHGGAYFGDSSSLYPPHVLLNEDIVLITLQYRLGVLGFLSTEDEVMPGNQGLKDQALALRWVKVNVRQFGGDPEKITIFGESAGGGCVHFQVLSPKTDGLFARAILQSGSAISPRALGDAHRAVAYHTAAVVGCHQWDSYELLQCLQEARAEELVLTLPSYIKWRYLPIMLGPRVDGDFLPDDPEVLVRDGRHKKVDIISGINSHDGGSFVIAMYRREEELKTLQKKFPDLGPVSMSLKCIDDNPLLLANKMFHHYLGGVNLDQADPDDVMKLYTDRHFGVCHDLTAILHSRNSINPLAHTSSHQPRIYTYELQYRGEHSLVDLYNMTVGKHWVTHADDLKYFFNSGRFELTRAPDLALRDLFTKLWTNFADTGNPTPDSSLGFIWEPTTEAHLQHLVLSPSPFMQNDTRRQDREFLTSLSTRQYRLLLGKDIPLDKMAYSLVEEEPATHSRSAANTLKPMKFW
nr:carboxylic ester hydrolase-like [Cherax quadricarinatus]